MAGIGTHAVYAIAAVAIALIGRDIALRMSESEDLSPPTVVANTANASTPKTLNQFQLAAGRDGVATLRKAADGFYWAQSVVNDRSFIRFMVDTGASVCVLSHGDAEKLGIDWRALPKDVRISTAGGDVRGSEIMLDKIRVSGVELNQVRAVVLEKDLDQSLLGMSFLERASEWRSVQNTLIIYQ